MKWKIHIINYFHKQKRTLIILIRKNWQLVMEKTKWERWEKLVSVILILVNSSEWVSESRSVVSDSLQPHRLYSPWNSPGQNTGEGSYSFLLGIFPTQESNWGLLHCRWMLPAELLGTPIASLTVLEIVNCNWLIKDWGQSLTKKPLQTEEPTDEMCLTEVLSKHVTRLYDQQVCF